MNERLVMISMIGIVLCAQAVILLRPQPADVLEAVHRLEARTNDRIYRKEFIEFLRLNPELKRPFDITE